ncbi:MAG TPA: sigma-70 family RNA polymerase sigma factor [Baekduia sp.]|uniref:RNA polymerase sigma factor n=1 Tax=Baekduia sp. TaxID=2600305 RepID=UPI002D788E02|nr:sigma-70 family RNA polymerase sigma factor [Baekduia sp.]HET6506126.1 sigma-70 family RNA polymerase sigma factor [Baekduia sp.]
MRAALPPATGTARVVTLGEDDFLRLYRRMAGVLLVFFQRRLHDAELATDLTADTFTMALERRDQYRGASDEELSGWVWAIARSLLRDHERREETGRRTARRLGRERRALTDREIERIEELAGIRELREAVAAGMADLPEDLRVAVALRVLDDLSYTEIAARLGITASGARTRVSRALRILADRIRRQHTEWKTNR